MAIGIGYARQSRAREAETEADSLSLDAQETEIRTWADRNDWTIDRVIRDHDLSGGTLDRPGWQEVRNLVTGGGIDGVITVAVSRVARDNLLQETAWRELKSLKSTIISIREPNLDDDMLRGILGVFGQAERKRISRFVTAAVHERRKRGLHHGAAPFGLRLGGQKGDKHRRLELDPDTFPIARELADRLLAGQTSHAIWRWLVETGVPSPLVGRWSPESVRKWFSRPSIAGAILLDGELIPDTHPGVVTLDEWQRMQQLLDASRHNRDHVRMDSWLRGLVYHGCGRKMTVDTANKATGTRYLSFTCAAPDCTLRPRKGSARKIESAAAHCLIADLSALLVPQDALRAWSVAHDGARVAKTRARLEREQARLETEHSRAEHLYITGTRDASWLAEHDERYKERARAITAELAALDRPPDLARLTTLHAMARTWADAWATLALTERAVIMRQVGVVVLCGDTLHIEYQDGLATMVEQPMARNWRNGQAASLEPMSPADIRALRKRMGLTQAEFAAELAKLVDGQLIGYHSVSRWERGVISPSGMALAALRVLWDEAVEKEMETA